MHVSRLTIIYASGPEPSDIAPGSETSFLDRLYLYLPWFTDTFSEAISRNWRLFNFGPASPFDSRIDLFPIKVVNVILM